LRALLTDALDAGDLLDDDSDDGDENDINRKAVSQVYNNSSDDGRFVYLFCRLFQLID